VSECKNLITKAVGSKHRQIKSVLTATFKQVEEAMQKTKALQQRFFFVLNATCKQEDPFSHLFPAEANCPTKSLRFAPGKQSMRLGLDKATTTKQDEEPITSYCRPIAI